MKSSALDARGSCKQYSMAGMGIEPISLFGYRILSATASPAASPAFFFGANYVYALIAPEPLEGFEPSSAWLRTSYPEPLDYSGVLHKGMAVG